MLNFETVKRLIEWVLLFLYTLIHHSFLDSATFGVGAVVSLYFDTPFLESATFGAGAFCTIIINLYPLVPNSLQNQISL